MEDRILEATIPSNKKAEEEILSSILLFPNRATEILNALDEAAFYFEQTRTVFSAMKSLANDNQELSVTTIIEELKRHKQDEKSDFKKFLLYISQTLPYKSSVDINIRLLNEKLLERQLISCLEEYRKKVFLREMRFNEMFLNLKTDLDLIASRNEGVSMLPIGKHTDKVFNEIIERRNLPEGLIGLNTGFSKLNDHIFGFKKTELLVLAARPGVGKTTLALNFVINACKAYDKINVAVFSLEMGISQLVCKFLANISGVPLANILRGKLTPEELALVTAAKTELDTYNIRLEENPNTYLDEIVERCHVLKRENNLDFVVIDYLQLIQIKQNQNRSTNRNDEIGKISRALKKLAIELKIPIIALSQLNRKAESDKNDTSNPEPELHHLRESGSIEQDADTVIFLHDTIKRSFRSTKEGRKMKMIVAKNRHGETGDFQIRFLPQTSTFVSENMPAKEKSE